MGLAHQSKLILFDFRSKIAIGWGIAGGLAVLFLTERLPMFRRDLFSKVPLIGTKYSSYREDKENDDEGEEGGNDD